MLSTHILQRCPLHLTAARRLDGCHGGKTGPTLTGLLCGLLALALNSPCAVAVDDPVPSAKADVPARPSGEKKTKEPSRYKTRRDHDPDGIGKFYMGREIAHVMGFQGIDWLERPEREQEESLVQRVDALKLEPGMIVADIGAGSGVLTLMMARKVGAAGKVLAVDVQQEMLDRLAGKLKLQKIDNVELIKGEERTPSLAKATVDLAIMVDVYHEFAFPYEMIQGIAAALKPGGRVVFVEYRKEDPAVPIKLVHKMTQKQVRREIEQAEFQLKWKETIGVLPRQHIIIFEREPSGVAQPANQDSAN